jgi:hypothetical protein
VKLEKQLIAGADVAGAIFTAPAGNNWDIEIKDRKWK